MYGYLFTGADIPISSSFFKKAYSLYFPFGRMEEKAKAYTVEEQEAFLARSIQLLEQLKQIDANDTEVLSYLQRVENLAKNKRTRGDPSEP